MISAQYQDDILSFVYNKKDTLHYKPENGFDFYRLGFGFDGVGVLRSIYPRIRILKNQ